MTEEERAERSAAWFLARRSRVEVVDTLIELGREVDSLKGEVGSLKAQATITELAFKHTKKRLEEAERQRDAYRSALETTSEVLGNAHDELSLAKAIIDSRLSTEP